MQLHTKVRSCYHVLIVSLFLQNQAAKNFIRSKNNHKINQEMGLLCLSNLAIYIKKAELSGFKALRMISKMRWHPKFNLGQLDA